MTCTCNLAQILRERHMTQADLVRSSGCRQETISTAAAGKSMPLPKTVKKITEALGLSIDEVWPNYEAEYSELKRRRVSGLYDAMEDSGKWPSRQKKYVDQYNADYEARRAKEIRNVRPDAPNAVPMADGWMAGDYRLEPVMVSNDKLQDAKECRKHAMALHGYLLNTMAYGVYRELLAIMAAENRLFEERAAKVAANGREEASI